MRLLDNILQSDLTYDQYKDLGLKQEKNGELYFYDKDENIDEVLNKIKKINIKSLLKRYTDVGAEIVPFKTFFTDGDKRNLDGFKVEDLELKTDLTEKTSPSLTELLFGYYG